MKTADEQNLRPCGHRANTERRGFNRDRNVHDRHIATGESSDLSSIDRADAEDQPTRRIPLALIPLETAPLQFREQAPERYSQRRCVTSNDLEFHVVGIQHDRQIESAAVLEHAQVITVDGIECGPATRGAQLLEHVAVEVTYYQERRAGCLSERRTRDLMRP